MKPSKKRRPRPPAQKPAAPKPAAAPAPAPAVSQGRGRRLWWLLAVLVVLAGLLVWSRWTGPGGDAPIPAATTPDPRLTYATEYKNVRPGVRYVGDAECAACHADVAARYAKHPMGRSLAPVGSAAPVEDYAAAHFEADGLHYAVERRGGKVFHVEKKLNAPGEELYRREVPIDYAVGSGRTGRSYLWGRDGYLLESPITWYAEAGTWGLSPGYDKRQYHFERAVLVECLFCHANRVEPVLAETNRYEPPLFRGHAIGCERCHGPGELHARRHAQGQPSAGSDTTIVNPGKLTPVLRDAVCEQCHLHGEQRVARLGRATFDFRPGLPLHLFWAVYTRSAKLGESGAFLSQAEQLARSRCYLGSGGRLGCVSCHDPHGLPPEGEQAAFFRGKCLQCHGPGGTECGGPAERRKLQGDDCTACHMPKSPGTDVGHTSITDHRVPRRPEQRRGRKSDLPALPGEVPLVHFHGRHAGEDDLSGRDLGIALVKASAKKVAPVAALALPLLRDSLGHRPGDVAAREAYADALDITGDPEPALAEYLQALRTDDRREPALLGAAGLAERLGRRDLAAKCWRQLAEVNPYVAEYHYNVARHAPDGDWPAVLRSAEMAEELNPANLLVRKMVILGCVRTGRRDEARRRFEIYRQLDVDDADRVRGWLEE